MPRISSGMSKVRRMEPETVSIPIMPKPKPRPSETIVFSGAPPPKAMKEAKARK